MMSIRLPRAAPPPCNARCTEPSLLRCDRGARPPTLHGLWRRRQWRLHRVRPVSVTADRRDLAAGDFLTRPVGELLALPHLAPTSPNWATRSARRPTVAAGTCGSCRATGIGTIRLFSSTASSPRRCCTVIRDNNLDLKVQYLGAYPNPVNRAGGRAANLAELDAGIAPGQCLPRPSCWRSAWATRPWWSGPPTRWRCP